MRIVEYKFIDLQFTMDYSTKSTNTINAQLLHAIYHRYLRFPVISHTTMLD